VLIDGGGGGGGLGFGEKNRQHRAFYVFSFFDFLRVSP
jgi:hypothetical protein